MLVESGRYCRRLKNRITFKTVAAFFTDGILAHPGKSIFAVTIRTDSDTFISLHICGYRRKFCGAFIMYKHIVRSFKCDVLGIHWWSIYNVNLLRGIVMTKTPISYLDTKSIKHAVMSGDYENPKPNQSLYRGIMANILVHKLVFDTVNNMSKSNLCQSTEINNMVTKIIANKVLASGK